MAYFDFSKLKETIATKTGYTLFSEFGEIFPYDYDLNPHRDGKGNEIITPIVGVFKLNPVPLTALTTPYIAVVTGTLDIPAPTEMAEEVCNHLDTIASQLNATTEKITQGDTTFTVVYSFETCAVGDKRRDVSLYNGEIVEVTQTITFTIIERGITALDTEVTIDGIAVPFLRLDETRVATSETTPNAEGRGEVAITQEMYGITLDTPLVDNTLGELLLEIINDGIGNKAHTVTVTRRGKTSAYLMSVGSASSSANPPANIGISLSLAEISPVVARYNDLFKTVTTTETVVGLELTNAVVCWGDGVTELVKGYAIHVYADGVAQHTITYMEQTATKRYAGIKLGVSLYRKMLRPAEGITFVGLLPTNTKLITTTTGDCLRVGSTYRLEMVVNGVVYPVDQLVSAGSPSGWLHPFKSLMRGKVTQVNAIDRDYFEYDLWAVNEEDD